MRLLLVDDNVAQVESLQMLLKLGGHTVLTALNGLAARTMIETHPFDGVVIDLCMPGMSGQDLLTWMRSRPETAHTPVAIVSGLPTDHEAMKEACGQPCVRVLQKPFDCDEIINALEVKV